MLEPLSEPIRRLLLELGLCSEGDLRRARRKVRRLTHDLPAFDSVWLDALVQIGRLTPYQARILESSDPAAIRIGPCVVVNRLGGGPFGETLLARPTDSRELCVVKRLAARDRLSAETVERLEKLVAAAQGFEHPALVSPLSCFRSEHQWALVSRYIPGPHLAELLVRRGRFPAAVVWDIGRQLADGLQALEPRGLTHGDIRAANVRLTSGGAAVLVDAGIRPALDPSLTMHSGLAPERYDGIAPELIGVGQTPCTATDLYALGCLLWQLLAGRPPFPGGDPLIKLAAHQTRAIDDVRRWAPDTPADLARGISWLTARLPAQRPQRFSDLLEIWGPPGRRGRRALAGFRRRFDVPARSTIERRPLSAPTRWLFAAATLFAVSGGVATLVNQGARSVVLSWAAGISDSLRQSRVSHDRTTGAAGRASPSAGTAPNDAEAFCLPMPAPDRNGVVHLSTSGPYRATTISAVGELSIVGTDGAVPKIVIDDKPFKICAETVRLKNVRVITSSRSVHSASELRALVRVEAQSLTIDGCWLESGAAETGNAPMDARPETNSIRIGARPGLAKDAIFVPPTGPALVAWKLLDAADHRAGAATIRNTVMRGDGPALYLADVARQVNCDNVLKIGSGPLVQLAASPSSKSNLALRLSHTTTRSSGPLVRWVVPAEDSTDGRSKSGGPPRGTIQVETNDCVFDIASPRAALFELAGPRPHPEWIRALRMTGEGSVTRPTLEAAAWVSTSDGRLTPLEDIPLDLEGLVASEFQFAADPPRDPTDSEVQDSAAPRRSPAPPGIIARRLPHSK